MYGWVTLYSTSERVFIVPDVECLLRANVVFIVEKLCCMCGLLGVERGAGWEGVRLVACEKWGSWFLTWDQTGVKFVSCNDGHHPK
jgi:hypothetical protein